MQKLEEEERLREEAGFYAVPKIEQNETLMNIRKMARMIREVKSQRRQTALVEKTSNKPTIPRTAPARARERSASRLRDSMTNLGIDMEGTEDVSFVLQCFYCHRFYSFVGAVTC